MNLITLLTDISKSKSPHTGFREIAEELMNGWCIRKGFEHYEIIEIEFYLYSKVTHKDDITYKRQIEAGRWFFHQSGVDISFESDENSYGGILIRSIKNLNTPYSEKESYICGPLRCVYKLWDDANAFNIEINDYPILEKYDFSHEPDNLIQCTRWIPGKSHEKSDFLAAEYRFIKKTAIKALSTIPDYKACKNLV